MFSWGKIVGSESSGCKTGGKPWCNSRPALCQSPGKWEKKISGEYSLEKQKILRTKGDLAHQYGIILLLRLATSFEESKCFIAELHSNIIHDAKLLADPYEDSGKCETYVSCSMTTSSHCHETKTFFKWCSKKPHRWTCESLSNNWQEDIILPWPLWLNWLECHPGTIR